MRHFLHHTHECILLHVFGLFQSGREVNNSASLVHVFAYGHWRRMLEHLFVDDGG